MERCKDCDQVILTGAAHPTRGLKPQQHTTTNMLTPEEYDPPTYGGTPQQEAHQEMVLLFGAERPERAWILSDYNVWEPNPFYQGPPQPHPEDDHHW